MAVKPVPDGYHTITPYLVVPEVEQEIAFLERVFAAEVTERVPAEDGKIRHGEARVGDSMLMMGRAREAAHASRATLYLYLPDVDAVHARARAAGAREIQPPTDQPYGDRTAAFEDPAGNAWYVATRKENLSEAEIRKRMQG